MSEEYKKGPDTVYEIQYNFVRVTKYHYHILTGDVALRVREVIRQMCEARNITVLKGHVSKDHIHVNVSCPPDLAACKIAQYLKGKSSRIIQQEFSHLRERYWGKHLWAHSYFCARVGKVTEQMIAAFIEHQEKAQSKDVFTVSDDAWLQPE